MKKSQSYLFFAGTATCKILNTLRFVPWEIRDSDRVLNCILPLLNYNTVLILSAFVKVNWIQKQRENHSRSSRAGLIARRSIKPSGFPLRVPAELLNSSSQVTFLCDLADGGTKLGKNQDFAEKSVFFIKEEEKCLTVSTSRQVVKGSRMEGLLFFNRNGNSNPRFISRNTNVCMQSTLQINLQFPLLFLKQVQKTKFAGTKARVTSVICTNYFRRSHCGDDFF